MDFNITYIKQLRIHIDRVIIASFPISTGGCRKDVNMFAVGYKTFLQEKTFVLYKKQAYKQRSIEYRSDDVIEIHFKNFRILTTWSERAP